MIQSNRWTNQIWNLDEGFHALTKNESSPLKESLSLKEPLYTRFKKKTLAEINAGVGRSPSVICTSNTLLAKHPYQQSPTTDNKSYSDGHKNHITTDQLGFNRYNLH